MTWFLQTAGLTDLFNYGGGLLWVIAGISTVMWMLILERYMFFWFKARGCQGELMTRWKRHHPDDDHGRERLLEGLVKLYTEQAERGLLIVNTMTAVLPLVGLLGTVNGMIKIFEVMTLFGSGDARSMASGISEALITTMAGLMTSLSGIYFAHNLEDRAMHDAEEFRISLHNA
jgi:biopolymer transport protein ExbB